MLKLYQALLLWMLSSDIALAAPSRITEQDIIRYADEINFADPKLVASIAKIESNYYPRAVNIYKGTAYYGLMQMSYDTARAVGFKGPPNDLFYWKVNVKYSIKYLEYLIREHKALRKVIASYNAGTVYYCRKKCPVGQFVNEDYVLLVMDTYRN